MYIINYFYFILYFGYFTGIIGLLIGSINGYNKAKNNIIQFKNEFKILYNIIDEYSEQIIQTGLFIGFIGFIIGMIFSIIFPIFILYLSLLYLYRRIIKLFYHVNYIFLKP